MKFKNIFSQSCKISFNGLRLEINGEFETNDKELIAFLEKAPDFVKIENENEVKENTDIEVLKKTADELGISYPMNIGAKKLQSKIDEFLNK